MKKLELGALKTDNTPFSAEEIKINNDFVDFAQTAIKEATVGMLTKEEAEAAIKSAVEATEEKMKPQIDKLYNGLLKTGLQLEEMKLTASVTNAEYDIEKQLFEQKEQIQSVIKSSGQHHMTLKTNYTRSSVTSNPMGTMLPEYGLIGAPKLTIYGSLPHIPIGPESNGVVRYIDQTTGTRNAAFTSEGSALPESAVAWTGYTLDLQKVGTTLPITEESLRFTSRLAAEVELFLQTDVACAIDGELATGSGSAPHIWGVYTKSTAYTAAAANIPDASIYDLIVKMSEDITGNTTYGGKYMPNVAYMNISDINKMTLKKDANYNYILPPFVTRDGKVVAGITIIESPFITANTMCLGDNRRAVIYEDGGYELAYGYNLTGDFAKDILTMKAKKFLALLIKSVDATGWRKSSDITADINTISGVA
jgi:hypothetical protein